MITEKDLLEAIAECQGTRNPNANTCIKLAAYYTILNNLNPKDEQSEPMLQPDIPRNSDLVPLIQTENEFMEVCTGKDIKAVLGVISEHLEAIKLLYPKEYNSIIEKIESL